jgi:septal ring-binding cell division protein DamX
MSFEGELSDLNLIGKLVELGKEHFTGAIRFENDGIIKIIYFKNGDVLSASTNDRTDSIDEILLRAGKVSREHVKQALAKRKESETLGDALLNLGYITRKELTWARRVQVLGIIRSIEGWTAGSYTIVDEYLPKREEGTLFPLSQILLELVVTDPDRSRYEQALDSGNVVYAKKLGFEAMFKLLGLNQDAEDIARQIDGARSAADVAAASGKDTFNVFKLLYALEMLGMLERAELMPAPAFSDANDRSAVTEAFPMVGVEAHEPEPVPAMPAWDAEPWDSQQSDNMPRWDAAPVAAATNTWDERPYDASTDLDLPAHFDEPPGEFAPSPTINSLDPVEVRSAVNENLGLHDGDAASPGRRVGKGLMWALVTVLLLAAGGFGAYRWWDSRQAPEPVFVARPKHRPIVPAPLPAPVTPLTASGTPATSSTGDTTGLVTSTTPTTATVSTATIPPVVASSTHAPVLPPTTTMATTTASAPAPKTAAVTPPRTVAPQAPTAGTTTLVRKNGTPTITNLNGKPPVESGHPARPEPVRPTKIAKVALPPAPIPATVSSTDPSRARYDSMARDFSASADASRPFTVQFELVCQTDSVRKAVSGGGNSVWFVPTTFQGKPCYRVFWGHYASRQEALQSLNAIPGTLRAGSTPTVVRYAH